MVATSTPFAGGAAAPADPAALRSIFGRNLRLLCDDHTSVAGICREMGLNRTQFNRYLSGESFPRPDILHLICQFFGVDARILLEPMSAARPQPRNLMDHPMLKGFLDTRSTVVPEGHFPSGFYRFLRRSFLSDKDFVTGVVHVSRRDGHTFLRGFEPRAALRKQGLSLAVASREFRGPVMRQEEGIMALVTHRDALTCSFNFLTPETSIQANLWEGYAARTVREKVNGRRAVRMIYEYLGTGLGPALAAGRQSGLTPGDALPRYYRQILQFDREFR